MAAPYLVPQALEIDYPDRVSVNLGNLCPGRITSVSLRNFSAAPIPGALRAMTALERLQISTAPHDFIGDGFERLQPLARLSAANLGDLSPTVPNLSGCTALRSLELSFKPTFGDVAGAEDLAALSQLTRLVANKGASLAPALGALTQLRELVLSGMAAMPPALGGMCQLRRLRLAASSYVGPSCFDGDDAAATALVAAAAAHLTSLSLEGIGSRLPPALSGLSALKELTLWGIDSRGKLTPGTYGALACLSSLTRLELGYYNLSASPALAAALSSLSSLRQQAGQGRHQGGDCGADPADAAGDA